MAKARLRKPGDAVRQDYFQWLCEIADVVNNRIPYWLLAGYLHSTEFKPGKIANDENRAKDGIHLREEYLSNHAIGMGPLADLYSYIDGPCTMLEFLVALARRMAFQLEDPDENVDRTPTHFWEMCFNLGLCEYRDDVFAERDGAANCGEIIHTFCGRRYQPNGYGGLFPLECPTQDQRRVEIWNQMNAYIIERY